MQPGGIRPSRKGISSKGPASRGVGTAGSRVRTAGINGGMRNKSNTR